MNQPFPAPLVDAQLAENWNTAWSGLGRPPPPGLRQQLEHAWAEPQRHYHDLRHLGECLALWSRWREHCERPAEVAIALWFHDAIYDTRAGDNELNSAAWATRSLTDSGLASDVAQRVHDLVMATRHDAPAEGPDAELLVDIDLAILGSPPERFEAYDRDVRAEYAWVPDFVYRRKRLEVLRSFADRPQLYRCQPAVDLLETQAHLNLAVAIARLGQ